VWLGNVRANSYSRNHTTLGFLDPAFWAFTWDDIAARDLPAMLERELQVTGAKSLAYVGHSQVGAREVCAGWTEDRRVGGARFSVPLKLGGASSIDGVLGVRSTGRSWLGRWRMEC
jgi:lysosomal acid lipase/cholesteryl ester hydrolase